MREVMVRVRDHHGNDQMDDDEDVAQHAAFPAKRPRSQVELESLGIASAIRQRSDARRLPRPSVLPFSATVGDSVAPAPPSLGVTIGTDGNDRATISIVAIELAVRPARQLVNCA